VLDQNSSTRNMQVRNSFPLFNQLSPTNQTYWSGYNASTSVPIDIVPTYRRELNSQNPSLLNPPTHKSLFRWSLYSTFSCPFNFPISMPPRRSYEHHLNKNHSSSNKNEERMMHFCGVHVVMYDSSSYPRVIL
jgi:hypothetical protein